MNIFYRSLGVSFIGLVLTSCLTTQSVPIDQLEPGKVLLPAQVRKVTLISRNFKFSIDTLGRYTNLNFQLIKGENKENLVLDSIAVTKSLEDLRKALLESGQFDEVFVYPYNTIKPHSGVRESPLSAGFIHSLCAESETNAVISLEMLSFFYSRHKGTQGHEISAEANVKITALWSVYTPDSDNPADRYTHSEVISWNKNNCKVINHKFKLPGRKEAISMASGIAARNYSKRIVPNWVESSRVLIGYNNPDFDKALSLALKNKWKEASGIWEKYTGSTNPRCAGVAALNEAIAQEMLGDYDKATFWSDKSVKLLRGESVSIARAYAAVLYGRKLKASRLNSLLKTSHP